MAPAALSPSPPSFSSQDELALSYTPTPPLSVVEVDAAEDQVVLAPLTDAKNHASITVDVPASTLINPRGNFQQAEERLDDGQLPRPQQEPNLTEREALWELLAAKEACAGRDADRNDDDFTEIELDDFCIYLDGKAYPDELRPLHHLATKPKTDWFYFDGVLRAAGVEYRVLRVPFQELPIGGYGPEHDTVRNSIWIRSWRNRNKEVYYLLKKPAAEYVRFHEPFLWVADLAKHFVDYCAEKIDDGHDVSLDDFRLAFGKWLNHRQSAAVAEWRRQHRDNDDFRTSINANIEFLWKETQGLPEGVKYTRLAVFQEIRTFARYPAEALRLSEQPSLPDIEVAPTVVTLFVYNLFKHMRLGKVLFPVEPVMTADEHYVGIPNPSSFFRGKSLAKGNAVSDEIRPGNLISTLADSPDSDTRWRVKSETVWYALVQKVHVSAKSRSFDVKWMYQPGDTPCGNEVYPWHNELFLSDHCSCDEGPRARIAQGEVLGIHSVEWGGSPTTTCDFFVRQTYIPSECRWMTLQKDDLTCSHHAPIDVDAEPSSLYQTGDTVLAALSSHNDNTVLEPYEVAQVIDSAYQVSYRLRRLLRRNKVDPQATNAPPNELVYTDHFVLAGASNIAGRCIVRVFKPRQSVPTPYDRNGTGNVFFITHRETLSESQERIYQPIDSVPESLRQGFDPAQLGLKKLRGMDLFCGSGNLGRGLEEGGAIKYRWANDIWDKAIHSYMANDGGKVTPFLGSVDDMLFQGLTGQYSKSVPAPGQVDFISGGSPCQGFSRLTQDQASIKQVKNRSMIASFASFVDFYRPKYGILENVLSMISNGTGKGMKKAANENGDVFSQLMCTIIGLGYQAQVIMGDAWRHGAPQHRSRVFLYFAQPGLRLPNPPQESHSHPLDAKPRRIGQMSNGEPYFDRKFTPTPFQFVSAGEATADLPDILDGKPDTCIPFPDHRLSMGMTSLRRHQASVIPIYPYGMNFVSTWNNGQGRMTPAERTLFPESGVRVERQSTAWGRVRRDGLFSTVATAAGMADARIGRVLHWAQTRPLTVLEARRAQGFPDREVLVGGPRDQWRLVGNSVARQMALALGLAFREAWLGMLYEPRGDDKPLLGLGPEAEDDDDLANAAAPDRDGAGAGAGADGWVAGSSSTPNGVRSRTRSILTVEIRTKPRQDAAGYATKPDYGISDTTPASLGRKRSAPGDDDDDEEDELSFLPVGKKSRTDSEYVDLTT